MVLPDSVGVSPAPTYSGFHYLVHLTFTGLSPSTACFPKQFNFNLPRILWSYNPEVAVTTPVWARPLSLTTTQGITIVLFSSGYLDVSVLRVCSYGNWSSTNWVLPFGNQRISVYLPLPAAYRSLSRPSSPLRA